MLVALQAGLKGEKLPSKSASRHNRSRSRDGDKPKRSYGRSAQRESSGAPVMPDVTGDSSKAPTEKSGKSEKRSAPKEFDFTRTGLAAQRQATADFQQNGESIKRDSSNLNKRSQ